MLWEIAHLISGPVEMLEEAIPSQRNQRSYSRTPAAYVLSFILTSLVVSTRKSNKYPSISKKKSYKLISGRHFKFITFVTHEKKLR